MSLFNREIPVVPYLDDSLLITVTRSYFRRYVFRLKRSTNMIVILIHVF